MTTHTFTLIAQGHDLQHDDLVDALYEAGCDDALIGQVDGIHYIDFDRDAPALDGAVLSAIADIETIDGINVVRIADAGLVSMADIAARTGRTRESIRLLITGERGPGGFPPPVTDPRSRYRLWQTTEVDRWLHNELGIRLDGNLDDDHIRAAINAGLELRQHRPHINDTALIDLRTLVDL